MLETAPDAITTGTASRGRSRYRVFGVLAAALAAAGIAGMLSGAVTITPAELWQAIGSDAGPSGTAVILWQVRLPRVLLAVLVGAALGASGAAYQGLFRNPLADPYLLGAAAGAALGATVAITLAGGTFTPGGLPPPRALQLVPALAFVGAAIAVAVTLMLAGGARHSSALVLAGVVVGAILIGLMTVLMMSQPHRLQAVIVYTLGSFALARWDQVGLLAVYLAAALPLLVILGRGLNTLQLGDAVATTLGLRVARLRLLLVGAATLATAAAVSQVGVIGFVGLIVPHIMRRSLGDDYGVLIVASALAGATLLAVADALARLLVQPAELPVGVITTLTGGPFFLYLLRRHRAEL